MTTAQHIVSALLESDDIGDPKDFILDPATTYHHGVWDITIPEMRQLMRSLGWRVTGAYRRKRGSVNVNASKPVEPGTSEWGERDKLQQQVEQWLKQKFPNDQDAREIVVHCHVSNVAEWDDQYRPVRYGDTYNGTVEIIKHTDDGNPYA
jgi:hypothetical protein